MQKIEEEVGQSIIDVEYPRRRKKIQHLNYLLDPKHPETHPESSTIKKEEPLSAERSLEVINQSTLNAHIDKELVKRRLRENLVLAELITLRRNVIPTVAQQNESRLEIKPKIVPPKLSKAEERIRDYLLQKKAKMQDITPSDQLFLVEVSPLHAPRALHSVPYHKTMQSNLVVFPARANTQLNDPSTQSAFRGLTPGKWLGTGKEASSEFLRND